jgi:hypothetical protein
MARIPSAFLDFPSKITDSFIVLWISGIGRRFANSDSATTKFARNRQSLRPSSMKPGLANKDSLRLELSEFWSSIRGSKFNGEGGFACIYSSDQQWLLSWLSLSFNFVIILFLPANGNCFWQRFGSRWRGQASAWPHSFLGCSIF